MGIQKKSRKRDAILACVCSTDTHPTAEWVYTQLKPEIRDLSLGTVYRHVPARGHHRVRRCRQWARAL